MKRLTLGIVLPLACLLAGCGRNAELEALVRDQGARLQRLEDVEAIDRLWNAYGFYVDKHLFDQVVDLFAEQSSAEIAQRGIFLNKAGARRMFIDGMGRGSIGLAHGTLFNHIQVEPLITLGQGGTTAKGRFRAMVQVAGFGGNTQFWSDGIYENEFVKEDGVWKISKLKFWPTYYTPFDQGWAGKQSDCINGDGSGMSPGADKPSTDGAGVYPNVYFPPYHYNNPVTGKPVDVSALNKKALAETVWPDCPSRMPATASTAGGAAR